MLQYRARPWQLALHLNQRRSFTKTTATASDSGGLLSRLSERTRHAEQKGPVARIPRREPRSANTSFVSARSAQQRDHSTEKWFKDVRKLDINEVNQSHDTRLLSHKKHAEYQLRKHHQLRPKTDLNALFTLSYATSLRVQAKKEVGGDYASYLPGGYADPHRLPIDYARLALGRNKHIPLTAQTGALDIIEEAIRGRTTRQDCAV